MTDETEKTEHKNIYMALLAAQKKFGAIQKKTQAHNYKYADLAAVMDAILEPLNNEGILLIQTPSYLESMMSIYTTLIHPESETQIESTFSIPVGQQSAQAIGSAETYARRYALLAMLALAPEDDDGKGAGVKRDDPKVKTINEAQVAELRMLLGDDEEKYLQVKNLNSLSEIPTTAFLGIVKNLLARQAKQND